MCRCTVLSRVRLFATPWAVACQAPLFMGFPRQEHLSGLPFPSPGDLTGPGIKPRAPEMAGKFFRVWATGGLETHLVLFFTFRQKGGPLPSTFQGGNEGRGLFDFSAFPYPLLGRSDLWLTRLSVIWKETPGWASSGFSRPSSPPREGKVLIVQRGNLTQSLASWKPEWPLGSWGAWPHPWSLPQLGLWALTVIPRGD